MITKVLLFLVNNDRLMNLCIGDIPSVAWDMIDMADRPLTLVLDKGQYVANNVINNDGSLGIRKVKSGIIEKVIHRLGRPIISTSANFNTYKTPKGFSDIDKELMKSVDYICPIEFQPKTKNSASKIIRIRLNGEVEILRK